MEDVLKLKIRFRRSTASDWTTKNPVLLSGEPAVETDTGKFKIGDGVKTWTALPYVGGGDAPALILDHNQSPAAHLDIRDEIASKVDNADARLTDDRTPKPHNHVQSDVTGLSTAYDHSQVVTGNPHGTTAADVGADPSGTAATAVTVHTADTTAVHGIADTSALVVTSDARLSDARTPTAHTHPAADIASGTVGTARLGSGTADATTFLRGDQTWATAGGVTEVRMTTTSFHSLDGPANNPRPVGITTSQGRSRSILSPFTATGTTQVFGGVPWLPWSTVDIWIDFLNTNASAGDVKWQVAFGGQAGAHTQLTLYAATVAVTAASGNETAYGQRYTQKIASAVAVATTDMLDCQVVRLGDDAADTLAGSVWLKQLRFREAGT